MIFLLIFVLFAINSNKSIVMKSSYYFLICRNFGRIFVRWRPHFLSSQAEISLSTSRYAKLCSWSNWNAPIKFCWDSLHPF